MTVEDCGSSIGNTNNGNGREEVAKEKLIYKEGYQKGSMMLRKDCLPRLRNLPESMVVDSAEIKEAGVIERDGKRMEYQVIRVVLRDLEFLKETDQ